MRQVITMAVMTDVAQRGDLHFAFSNPDCDDDKTCGQRRAADSIR
jgi:hypothetical protein